MRIKFSATALIGIIGLAALGSTGVQAQHNHWFYNDYDRYDNQAYYDEGYYDEDGYFVYAPPRRVRPNKWQRRQLRLRRQQRLRRQALRRQRRAARREYRLGRQRLFDARRNGQYIAPNRRQVKKISPPKRLKLSYVPLPRTKPYHLIPAPPLVTTSTTTQPVKKITIDRNTNPADFDQRPVWKAAPVEKPVSKKEIEVAALPKVTAPEVLPKAKVAKPKIPPKITAAKPKKPKTPTAFKPIRIEVLKTPKKAELRKPRKKASKPASKPASKLASNQLSCDKAKAIVQGFGFSEINPKICTGTVYDFNAKRDGKPYSVKVSSLSGELKGVKKIK